MANAKATAQLNVRAHVACCWKKNGQFFLLSVVKEGRASVALAEMSGVPRDVTSRRNGAAFHGALTTPLPTLISAMACPNRPSGHPLSADLIPLYVTR